MISGFVFGFVFQLYFHVWILQLKAFVPLVGVGLLWIIYSVYLALFYGAACGIFTFFVNRIQRSRISFHPSIQWSLFPAIWIIFEWARSLGPIGNTAGTLGFTQTHCLPILQLASISGVYGISFYVVVVNIWLINLIESILDFRRDKRYAFTVIQTVFLGGLLVGMPCLWGISKLHAKLQVQDRAYTVAVIQGNHTQLEKQSFLTVGKIKKQYIELSTLASLKYHPDIIFWPETVIPELSLQNHFFMNQLHLLAQAYSTAIVFGTPVYLNGFYYNAAVCITETGLLPDMYLKKQLMPFGEYIPFRSWLEKIGVVFPEIDYSSSPERKVLQLPTLRLGGGICLESIYPDYYRTMTQNGADLLYVLVNNAWFFQSSAADEHLQMSILRAVENERYLVQAANTGISAIVDPYGRVIAKSALDTQAVLSARVYVSKFHTIYSGFGHLIVWISFLWLLTAYCFTIPGNGNYQIYKNRSPE